MSPLDAGIALFKQHFWMLLFLSGCINLLMLTAPLYMLQVYDRVLISRSGPTLVFLTLLAVSALGVLAVLHVIRSRVMVRLSNGFSLLVSQPLFRKTLADGYTANTLRDLDSIRTFLTGSTMVTLFDAPWAPLFLLFVYMLHPALGHIALIGAIVLFVLAWLNEYRTREALATAANHQRQATDFAEVSARNTDAIRSMGMLDGLQKKWQVDQEAGIAYQAVASDRAGSLVSIVKFVRFLLQVAILGVGAYLAIIEVITPGAMIAASIVMSRALAPVESSISSWQSLLTARRAYERLTQLFQDYEEREPMQLPAPQGHLSFSNVYGRAPGAEAASVKGLSFDIRPGEAIGMTGPSGAGKSSVVKLMMGIWRPEAGEVRLDGAEYHQWDRAELGQYIGYLPQDIELFPGTVAENIARFRAVEPDMIVAAAQRVGAHQMILGLPNGYDTVIGSGGVNLSGGQRQRVGLARAIFGEPTLLILDEPTSNLDAEGEANVRALITWCKQQQITTIIVAHKPSLIGGVDKLMVIQEGTVSQFGPLAEVLPNITRRVAHTSPGSKGTAKPAASPPPASIDEKSTEHSGENVLNPAVVNAAMNTNQEKKPNRETVTGTQATESASTEGV